MKGKILKGLGIGAVIIATFLGGVTLENKMYPQPEPVNLTAAIAAAKELGFANGALSIDQAEIKATAFEAGANSIDVEEIKVTAFEEGAKSVEGLVDTDSDSEDENAKDLKLVLNEIFDNDGKVEYLTDDLDDDELDMIVDRIDFVQEIKKLAVDKVDADFKDLMDKEDFNGTVRFFDEDEIERVRVQDDSDEITTDDVNYEDRDADVLVDVNFEQDDVKYLAKVVVEIKDGKVDDIDLDSVSLR